MKGKKKKSIQKILIYQWILVLFISGCGFRAANPNDLRFVYNTRSLFIEDFINNTFTPEIAEHARISLIEKIRRSPNLIYSNRLSTELLLTVEITTISEVSTKKNDTENAYLYRYTIQGKAEVVVNNESPARRATYSVQGSATHEKKSSSLENPEERDLRRMAAEDFAQNLFKTITLKF